MPDPASIRYYNPGAMWPGPSATAFGAIGYDTLNDGQRNKIARFPDAESGAAAQFDLLKRGYSGMTLSDAIRKWSGGNHWSSYANHIANATGLKPDSVLNADFLADPTKAIPLAKAMAQWEAGRPYPMTDEQWGSAHKRYLGGPTAAKPDNTPVTTGSLPSRTTPMPTDPVTGQWVPEQVIKSQYDRANQFWDTPRATNGLGALAEGLGGFFGMKERGSADDMVRKNETLKGSAIQGAMNETDLGSMGRRLLQTGIPGLQNQGMQLLAHEAQKKSDLQAQLEVQRQKAEFDRKLALESKRLEMEETMRQLKALGMLGGDATQPQAPTPASPAAPQAPSTVVPGAAPQSPSPANPNAEFADELLPSNVHKTPSAQQKAAVALILKQPGKAVDALNEKGEKPTEGQVKDASFAERMLRAEAGLREVVPTDKTGKFIKYDPTSSLYRFLPDWNVTNSKEWQQYSRNAREGIAAILRKDTGAAVSDAEWEWYFPMYYPQPGDSAQVVRDKQQARISVARGLRNGSGAAFDQMFPNFNQQLRERLLKAGADLTPKAPPTTTRTEAAPASDASKYAQVKRNPKTGEMAGYNPQTGKWEKIEAPASAEPPSLGNLMVP